MQRAYNRKHLIHQYMLLRIISAEENHLLFHLSFFGSIDQSKCVNDSECVVHYSSSCFTCYFICSLFNDAFSELGLGLYSVE
jgi:hypothetical protein